MSIISSSRPTLFYDAEVIGPWVAERAGLKWLPGRATAIGQMKDGQINAGVLYEDWNGANIVCHIAGEGDWANRRFLSVIYDYPFNYVGAKRITVSVKATNKKSIKLVEKMGFTLECTLAQATPDGDMLLFRMFKHECKYLRGKYALSN